MHPHNHLECFQLNGKNDMDSFFFTVLSAPKISSLGFFFFGGGGGKYK